MNPIYKPCCDMRCLLGNCKTRNVGGCYCLCRLKDNISTLKECINGERLNRGSFWIGNLEERQNYYDNLSPDDKEKEDHFRKVEAPEFLKQHEDLLQTYLIDEPNKNEH